MFDGYAYILSAFYWRSDGKAMFSPILEVMTIQDGGALEERVYRHFPLTLAPDRQVGISGMGDEKISKRCNLQIVKI